MGPSPRQVYDHWVSREKFNHFPRQNKSSFDLTNIKSEDKREKKYMYNVQVPVNYSEKSDPDELTDCAILRTSMKYSSRVKCPQDLFKTEVGFQQVRNLQGHRQMGWCLRQ